MKETTRRMIREAGAVAVGFASAGEIDRDTHEQFCRWVKEGNNGEMDYLERHVPLRQHTDNVMQEAKTVISIAFSYMHGAWRSKDLPGIAAYAAGDDYHIVIRELLFPVINELKSRFGGKWRLCIDSAPVAERYWALKSGIGKKGMNGSVIVPEAGGSCFLAEILTTVEYEPDTPSMESCDECGACIKACPANALNGDGTMKATKCINYLTIEKNSDFSPEESLLLTKGEGQLFGCDICMRVCPHNTGLPPTSIKYFHESEVIKTLTPEKIMELDEENFKNLFPRSPLLYAGLKRLQRNARAIKDCFSSSTCHKSPNFS